MMRGASGTIRRLLALAAGLGLLAPAARAQVDVFVSFMDEESAPPLEQLMKKYPKKKILVVERRPDKVLKEDRLFERPLSSYGTEKPKIVDTSVKINGTNAGSDIQNDLAKRIQSQMADPAVERRIQLGYAGGKAKTVVNGQVRTEMAVIDMNPSVVSEDVVILVRSPEMGLQPSMVEPFLTPILKSTTSLPQAAAANGGAHLVSYGAGGAIANDAKLAGTSKMGGSVFVGFEVEYVGGQRKYRSVVKLTDGEHETYFYKGGIYNTSDEADRAASKEYVDRAGRFSEVDERGLVKPGGKKLADAVHEVEAASGRTVGETASHFIGVTEKKVGAGIGLSNGAMEDSQVLTSAKRAGFNTIDVERFNSDPAVMKQQTTDRINSWAKGKKYNAKDYEDALMWGLEGKDIDKAKGSAFIDGDQGPFKGMKKEDVANQFYVVDKGPNKGHVLDGLYDEVASDMLADAAKGEMFGHQDPITKKWDYTGVFPKEMRDKLTPAQLKELDDLMAKKSGDLKARADKIIKMSRKENPNWDEIRKEVEGFIGEVRDIDLSAHPGLEAAIEKNYPKMVKGKRLAVLGGRGGDDQFEVWLRDGKWDGQGSRTLSDMVVERNGAAFNEASTDRLSFKSAMTPGLQETAVDRAAQKEVLLRAEGRMTRRVGDFKALGISQTDFEGFAAGLLEICGHAGAGIAK